MKDALGFKHSIFPPMSNCSVAPCSSSRYMAATFSLLRISVFVAAMCPAAQTVAADIYSEMRPRGGSYLFI
jgi:hypothetical protein